MTENPYLFNIFFYILGIAFIVFFTFYFISEIRVKRKRQKEWDRLKETFNCADEASLERLYKSYIATIEKHWLLGYIYPDM